MAKTLEELDKEVMADNPDAAKEKPQYASSPKNPASSCAHIRNHEPLKRNGYYWIKMKCMPEPARVYCDFDTNFPNFYLYKGHPRDKKVALDNTATPEDIRKHCGELGLQPVIIKSEPVFLHILDYLDESQSSSEDEFAIPFAYRYKILDKFRSFNNVESDDAYEAFKNHINKGFFDFINPISDTYV